MQANVETSQEVRSSPAVLLREVSKDFGGVAAVHQVNLHVSEGEFFTLLGPSGSGKTTILRMIAGLISPSGGTIEIDGEDVTRRRPYERNVAMVFQSLALIPHMDVFSNVAFPLRMRRVGRQEIARRVLEVLEKVGLGKMADRKTDQLSGGQRQRVALARALVYDPSLLLLDEPFGALDRRVREEMQTEVKRLHRDFGVTIINVTHDQREALRLSDRIAVVQDGRIAQLGTPEELYSHPTDPFVAAFLGDPTLVSGRLLPAAGPSGAALVTDSGLELTVTGDVSGSRGAIILRSEAVDLRHASDPPARELDNEIEVVVAESSFEGSGVHYHVVCEEHGIAANVFVAPGTDARSLRPGDPAWLGWNAENAPVVELPE